MEGLVNCPKCKAPNAPDKWVCDFCGARTTAGFQGDQRRKEEERLRKIAEDEAAVRAEEARKVELAKQAVLDAEAKEARAEEELKLQQQATEENQRRKLHRQDHDEFYQHWKSGRLSAQEALDGMNRLQVNSPKYPIFSWDARRIHRQKVAAWKAINQAKPQTSQTNPSPAPTPMSTSTGHPKNTFKFKPLIGFSILWRLIAILVIVAPVIVAVFSLILVVYDGFSKSHTSLPTDLARTAADAKSAFAGATRNLDKPSTRLLGHWKNIEGKHLYFSGDGSGSGQMTSVEDGVQSAVIPYIMDGGQQLRGEQIKISYFGKPINLTFDGKFLRTNPGEYWYVDGATSP